MLQKDVTFFKMLNAEKKSTFMKFCSIDEIFFTQITG
jgi:hypothetical protein